MQLLSDRARYFAEMQAYLVEAAVDLFEGYDLRVDCTPADVVDAERTAVMAVIGFASDTVRGSLLVLTSPEMVDRLQPCDLSDEEVSREEILRDVLGEFANMLLGRVKNKLVSHGITTHMSTPTTIVGDDPRLPAPRSGMSAWHTFNAGSDRLHTRFDVTFNGDFVLPPPDGRTVPQSGAMTLFEVCE